MIRARIGQQQQTRLVEILLDLVGERARGVATGDGLCAGVLRKLEHRALAVRARRHANDVRRVLDRHDDARCQHQLVPRLPQVHDVDTCRPARRQQQRAERRDACRGEPSARRRHT